VLSGDEASKTRDATHGLRRSRDAGGLGLQHPILMVPPIPVLRHGTAPGPGAEAQDAVIRASEVTRGHSQSLHGDLIFGDVWFLTTAR
jgi:hypothetical protein